MQCTMCGKPASEICKQCCSTHYCSRACQVADWRVHKLLCPSFPDFQTPPDDFSKRGIFFPVAGEGPKFVWIRFDWCTENGENYQQVDIGEFLGDGHSADRLWVKTNKMRSRSRDDALTLFLREAGAVDGSSLNFSVVGATRDRYVNICWPGPLLVLKTEGLKLGNSRLLDVDMVDLRDAVDVLCSYPNHDINEAAPEETWEVEGVRVNCTGEIEVYKREKYEAIKVPESCGVFMEPVVGISDLLGLPVRVYRCSVFKDADCYIRTNIEATFLHMNPNPGCEMWGWAPMEWQGPAGNVVIVRADRSPLHKQYAEALCRYCYDVLQPLFHRSMSENIARERVLEQITKEAFREYWREFDSTKRLNVRDRTWEIIKCPV